jgi:hypothetical protein
MSLRKNLRTDISEDDARFLEMLVEKFKYLGGTRKERIMRLKNMVINLNQKEEQDNDPYNETPSQGGSTSIVRSSSKRSQREEKTQSVYSATSSTKK